MWSAAHMAGPSPEPKRKVVTSQKDQPKVQPDSENAATHVAILTFRKKSNILFSYNTVWQTGKSVDLS